MTDIERIEAELREWPLKCWEHGNAQAPITHIGICPHRHVREVAAHIAKREAGMREEIESLWALIPGEPKRASQLLLYVDGLHAALKIIRTQLADAQREVERLKQLVAPASEEIIEALSVSIRKGDAESVELRAEIERLKEGQRVLEGFRRDWIDGRTENAALREELGLAMELKRCAQAVSDSPSDKADLELDLALAALDRLRARRMEA